MHEPTERDLSAARGMTRLLIDYLDGGPLTVPPFPITESQPGDPEPIYVALTADTWIDTGWWHSGVRG
jgi:hypothetical protein